MHGSCTLCFFSNLQHIWLGRSAQTALPTRYSKLHIRDDYLHLSHINSPVDVANLLFTSANFDQSRAALYD